MTECTWSCLIFWAFGKTFLSCFCVLLTVLHVYDIIGWQKEMNRLGRLGIPFFFMIDFEMKRPMITPLAALSTNILFQFNGVRNYVNGHALGPAEPLDVEAVSLETYASVFSSVQEEIRYGNTFLLNLSFQSKISSPVDLSSVFHQSQARYKLRVGDRFVVFSPETFVRIQNGRIATFPMKGTIDANLPNAAETILADAKELAEHYTIVDLLRNDLSIVAREVRVERFRYIDRIRTASKDLLQVSSEIVGQLDGDYRQRLGDIFTALLPAGSICGAPKKKTVEIIQRLEEQPRGYYTGVCGIFDGRDVDSGVMIRFIERIDGQYYYRSGGGITSMSQLSMEYQELLDKVYVPVA